MVHYKITFFSLIFVLVSFIILLQESFENDTVYGQNIENEIMENTLNTVEKATREINSLPNAVNSTTGILESTMIGKENSMVDIPMSLEEQLKLASEYLKNQQSLSIEESNNLESYNSNNKSIQFFKSNAYSPNTEANIINDLNSGLKIFESNITGIKLKYPSNWYFENNGYLDPSCIEQICKIVLYPYVDSTNNFNNNNDHSVGFIISSGSSNNPKFKEECKCGSLVEFVQSTYVRFFGNNENLSFVNDNQTTIAGNTSAWQLEFDIKNIDNYDNEIEKQGKMWTVWTMNDNAFYHIAYVADKESYSKYLPQAKQVVKSIEFIPIDEEFKIPKYPSFMENLNIEQIQGSEEEISTNNTLLVDKKETNIINETTQNQENKELTTSLLEEKEPELIKDRLKEKIDKVDGVTLKGNTSYTDSSGDMHIVGEVQNNLPRMTESVKIIGTFYDNNGNVIGMDYTYTEPSDLESHEKAPFDLILSNSSLPIERISDYSLKITWRK